MQLDGTSMPVHHKEKGKKQVVRRGTLWLVVGDATHRGVHVLVDRAQARTRATSTLARRIYSRGAVAGPVVADADTKFDASFKPAQALIECGCAMHGRRGFIKSLDAGNKRAPRSPSARSRRSTPSNVFLIEEQGTAR